MLPDWLFRIGASAFAQCDSLRSVLGGMRVGTVESDAFCGCGRLTEVSFLSGVKELGRGAFAGCSALEEVTLSRSMDRIGDEAFRSCRRLTRVRMPDHVASLGKGLFTGCFDLDAIEGMQPLAEAFPGALPHKATLSDR